jgi:hypothetical protein
MRSVSSRHRCQWSLARSGEDPSAMCPGVRAQSYQLLPRSPPSIWTAAVATPSRRPSMENVCGAPVMPDSLPDLEPPMGIL